MESADATFPDVEERLRRYKRPLYAVILLMIAAQALISERLLGTPLESVRYVVAAFAGISGVSILFVRRLFRVIEVGVFVVGAFYSLAVLWVALDGTDFTRMSAVRSFTIWTALLVVWAFHAFRSRLALALSATLLGLGVLRVGAQVVGEASAGGSFGFEPLANLILVGTSYLLLLFALTDSIERRAAALAAEETEARLLAVDTLTGVTNRAAFHRMHQQMTRGRGASPFSLVLVDVDDFSSINERFGTAVGDEILREAALRLANSLGQEARVLARLGGDVFGLLVDGPLEDEEAAELGARVAQAFRAPFTAGGGPLQVTATVGLSRFPRDAETPTEQVIQAEAAVSRAKREGQKFQLASKGLRELDRLALARDLKEALGKGEIELYFQPIATVVGPSNNDCEGSTAAVRTVETLLRWNHPERGTLQPEVFIPIAERAGLIVPIGTWVLEQACLQAARWEREGSGAFYVSVNISPHQFTEPGLVDTIRDALKAADLPPDRLLVEITETSAEQPVVERRLAEIRRLGVRVAIDDFGAGYSSLGRLRNMPIDYVKLDRSFVHGLDGDDTRGRLIVRAAVVLAHGLGAKVVAEGIESEPQATAAVNIGCDFLQGFLFDRPAPAAAFAESWRSGDEVTWCDPDESEMARSVSSRLS